MIYGSAPAKSYEKYCETFTGRHEASPAALREQIAERLDILFRQADFFSLERVYQLLAELAQDNDYAASKALLLRELEGKTQSQINCVYSFSRSYFAGIHRQTGGKKWNISQ